MKMRKPNERIMEKNFTWYIKHNILIKVKFSINKIEEKYKQYKKSAEEKIQIHLHIHT